MFRLMYCQIARKKQRVCKLKYAILTKWRPMEKKFTFSNEIFPQMCKQG